MSNSTMTPKVPSLLVTIQKMEDFGLSGDYDAGTGCHVTRNEDGLIELSHGDYVRTLKSLIENECRGLRGASLCAKIKEVMQQGSGMSDL